MLLEEDVEDFRAMLVELGAWRIRAEQDTLGEKLAAVLPEKMMSHPFDQRPSLAELGRRSTERRIFLVEQLKIRPTSW